MTCVRKKCHIFAGILAIFVIPAFFAGSSPAIAESAPLSVELNKLEPHDNSCRAYVVVNNSSKTAYSSLKLDLILFGLDGVIERRFALNLAPLKAEKRTVKLFDISGISCDKVGSFLINDVMECAGADGAISDCLAQMTLSSRSKVEFTK